MTESPVHLLDVNVLISLLDQDHVHNQRAGEWFDIPGLRWSLCAFTEAGILRFFTRPKTAGMSVEQVSAMLESLRQQPGYNYLPLAADWHELTKPFSKRLHGHNQVTVAYLLGLAIRQAMVLTTFDRALLHMAGEHKRHVLVLEGD